VNESDALVSPVPMTHSRESIVSAAAGRRPARRTVLLFLVFSVALCLCGESLLAQERTYSIIGEVRTPKTYQYVGEHMTILQAVAMAGGLTECGSMRRLKLRRAVDGTPSELDAIPTTTILPGDTIVVARRLTPNCEP
jgi:hypothetical protein